MQHLHAVNVDFSIMAASQPASHPLMPALFAAPFGTEHSLFMSHCAFIFASCIHRD